MQSLKSVLEGMIVGAGNPSQGVNESQLGLISQLDSTTSFGAQLHNTRYNTILVIARTTVLTISPCLALPSSLRPLSHS